MTQHDLDRGAIAAHNAGIGWLGFIHKHCRCMFDLAPDTDVEFARWASRLRSLVANGEPPLPLEDCHTLLDEEPDTRLDVVPLLLASGRLNPNTFTTK